MFIVSDKLIFIVTSVLTQVLRVGTALVMARLLTPSDYGLLTVLAVAPGFIAALGDCGVARALVQYQDLPKEVTEACALVISMALGILYCAIYIVSGIYLYAHGYREHETWIVHDGRLPWLALICGITLILSSVYNFQMACLNRDLRFRAESFQNALFSAAQATTGVSLALAAHWHPKIGVFALAVQPLVAQMLGNAVIYHRHPFAWPRHLQIPVAAKMLNFGWKITLAQYINTVQLTIISAVVVMIGGTYGAGIYGRATQVNDMISYNLMGSFDRLLYPVFRAVRDDVERFKSIFFRGCIAISLISTFGCAWLMGTAPDLIRVVLGSQWGGVPPLLRIVCLALATNGLATMGFAVINALNKPIVWVRISIANFILLLTLVGCLLLLKPHLPHPLEGVALVFLCCQVVYGVSAWVWVLRSLDIDKRKLAGHLARLLGAATIACVTIFLTRRGLAATPAILRLIVSSLTGFVAFMALAFLADREAILYFRTMVRRREAVEASGKQVETATDGETQSVVSGPTASLEENAQMSRPRDNVFPENEP